MRLKINRLLLFLVLAPLFAPVVHPVRSHAQHVLPYDGATIFKTHVPHLSSQIGKSPEPSPQAVSGSVPTTPFRGTAYVVTATVTPTTSIPQAEEHIAVDPNNPSTLVAAVSDFALGGYNTTKYVVSVDNGTSWIERYVPSEPFFGFLATSDGFFWLANSDPTVAIDKLGNVYLANLYLDVFDNGNGLYVSVGSLSSGVNFAVETTYPVATNPSGATNVQEDKPWIAVDNSINPGTVGNVYLCWTRFVGNSDSIVFSRSLDHGVHWTAPLRISPVAQDGAVQGCQVGAGPTGEVYVAYEVFFVGGKRQHFLAKSVDGGLTFTSASAVTPVFKEATFKSTYRKNSFTSLTVSPSNGHVYMVYAAQPASTVGAEVMFIASRDGGLSFSSPTVINDVSRGQQFFPAITTDTGGVIHDSWFDTRNSSGSTALYDIYATYSEDDGATFAPNARVTSSLISAGAASFIGDYAGIVAAAGFAHPVWTSGGFNNGSLQTEILVLP